LSATPRIKFSHPFQGTIWNTLALPKRDVLIIEVRDDKNFQVQFSALDFQNDKFLWEGITLKEKWWVGLTAANENTILFHTYVNKGNPDHKNLIAFDIFNKNVRWEVDEFSFFDWDDSEIWGYRTNDELTQAMINIESGVLLEKAWMTKATNQRKDSTRPVQYLEGMPHFETVKMFVQQKTHHQPVRGVEYLEWKDWIMVSFYTEEETCLPALRTTSGGGPDRQGSLANYLLVLTSKGEVLLEVKLGEKLTGLGTDTFFMVSGCLFLVKNKSELVVYTFYD
jgi:hypothetical protein